MSARAKLIDNGGAWQAFHFTPADNALIAGVNLLAQVGHQCGSAGTTTGCQVGGAERVRKRALNDPIPVISAVDSGKSEERMVWEAFGI